MDSPIGRRAALLLALVLWGGIPRASAQVFLGRIDVSVKDAAGAALPGVRLTLSAAMDGVRTSDLQGEAHFQNLPVDTYTLTGTFTGFTTATAERVQVVAGAGTRVVLTLRPSAASQEAAPAAATVLVDPGRSTITTRVLPEEFQDIPSPRDPWAWLPTIATVYSDRVNVGGAESGHQSAFTAKGAQAGDNLWSLDGVPVTDMGTAGASAFFYDVDGLAEMAVTTGGADARNATGGVQSQMLLKSGGAAPHGGVHYYYEGDRLQTVNISNDLALALASPTGNSNRMGSYNDLGFDLGGPLLQDHAWIWGTVNRANVTALKSNDLTDETRTTTYALKADGIIAKAIRGNFTFFENSRTESGRDGGLFRLAEDREHHPSGDARRRATRPGGHVRETEVVPHLTVRDAEGIGEGLAFVAPAEAQRRVPLGQQSDRLVPLVPDDVERDEPVLDEVPEKAERLGRRRGTEHDAALRPENLHAVGCQKRDQEVRGRLVRA